MRILHVLDHSIPLHSGYTFRTAAILREQHALGWETFHVTSPKQINCNMLEEEIEGLHFYRTPQTRNGLNRLPVFNQLADIWRLESRLDEVVRMVQPDILHAHSPVLDAIPALRVGKRHGIPVVYEVRAFWEDAAVDHGTTTAGSLRYRITRGLETYAFRRADAVTCICEGLRSDIVARGIPSDKVTVIPNAVDIAKFPIGKPADETLKAQLGLQGTRVLGFLGSFYAYEGLDLLLGALPAILQSAPDIRVLLVGGGPQETNLKTQAQGLGIADKVIFSGRIPHEQINRYYDLVDLLVYPRHSMRLTELVTPLKPLEAAAQGKILIASDVGGHKELIRDGETGILFRAGDAIDLANKALALLASPEKWPKLQTAGRQFVENERNWKHSVSYYQQVYAAILKRAG